MRVHEFTIGADVERSDLAAISADCSRFVSTITMQYKHNDVEHTVDVKSLLGMMSVPVAAGTVMYITTKGKDEEEAMHHVFELFRRFI